MKWSVKKPRARGHRANDRAGNERRRRDTKRLWNVAQRSPEVGGTRSWGTLRVDWGEIFWIIHSGSRRKKDCDGTRAQSEGRRSVNSRFARVSYGKSGMVNHRGYGTYHDGGSECYKSGEGESRKATREAAMTLASEIGNCPANRITNACALWPLMESKHPCEMLRVTSTECTRRDETREFK